MTREPAVFVNQSVMIVMKKWTGTVFLFCSVLNPCQLLSDDNLSFFAISEILKTTVSNSISVM